MQRRTFLAASSAVATTLLAGCFGGGDNGSESGDNSNGGNSTNESAGSSNESEESGNESSENGERSEDQQDPTNVEQGENIEEYNGLVINEHEVVEEEYSTAVEGIVENTTNSQIDYVQVRVRAYDADRNQLDSYLDNTQDLSASGTWAFSVSILDAEEFADYDIQVSDSPL